LGFVLRSAGPAVKADVTFVVQVFILDALADYEPLSPSEARGICERVQLRLQSGNAAVVLSAVKVRHPA
jgi:vesicle coat complex subunit